MTKLSIQTIIDYIKKNGDPNPTNEQIMHYVDAEKYQNQIDEAVLKNYHPADLDRWIILMNLFNLEITYDTAMTISNALDEDEINPTDVYDLGPSSIEQKIYKQAIKDYDELVYKVSKFHDTFENLCIYLKGYNYDMYNGLFDCNYKTIRATIKHNFANNYYQVCIDIDVWDDKHTTMVKEQITINELRKLVNEND